MLNINNVDSLVKKAIDNWSYEFIDKFLNKENLSDEYLLLVYKLGKYDFYYKILIILINYHYF